MTPASSTGFRKSRGTAARRTGSNRPHFFWLKWIRKSAGPSFSAVPSRRNCWRKWLMKPCPFIGKENSKILMGPFLTASHPFPNPRSVRRHVEQGPPAIWAIPRALFPETPQLSQSQVHVYSNRIVTNTVHSSSASSACIVPPSKKSQEPGASARGSSLDEERAVAAEAVDRDRAVNLVGWDLLARAEVDANRFELFLLDDGGRSLAAKGVEVNYLAVFCMLDSHFRTSFLTHRLAL